MNSRGGPERQALAHARRAFGIMRRNRFQSGVITVIQAPLAALRVLRLAAVVANHKVAEVVVIANGLRAGHRSTSGVSVSGSL